MSISEKAGRSERFFNFEKERYSDPEYLNQCRWMAADFLSFVKSENPDLVNEVKAWIEEMGVTTQGRHEGILLGEEVGLIIQNTLQYPQPWNTERCKRDVPEKYDSVLGLFAISVPDLLEKGYTVGIASGCFDIFHAGYSMYLRECKKHCDILVVGVDDNYVSQKNRQDERPFNDLSVRLGTISEMFEVCKVFRIGFPEIRSWPPGRPYNTLFYSPLSEREEDWLQNRERYLEEYKKRNPGWFEIANKLKIFWTSGDPAAGYKKAGAELCGAQGIEIPKFTRTLSSTIIGKHFGVKPNQDRPNTFGVAPHWRRSYDYLARNL